MSATQPMSGFHVVLLIYARATADPCPREHLTPWLEGLVAKPSRFGSRIPMMTSRTESVATHASPISTARESGLRPPMQFAHVATSHGRPPTRSRWASTRQAPDAHSPTGVCSMIRVVAERHTSAVASRPGSGEIRVLRLAVFLLCLGESGVRVCACG